MNHSNLDLLRIIWSRLTVDTRKRYGLLLGLISIVTVLEIVTLILLPSFMTALVSMGKSSGEVPLPLLKTLVNVNIDISFGNYASLLAACVVAAGLARVILLKYNSRLAFSVGAEFSKKILKNVVNKSLVWHMQRNSSALIGAMTVKCDVASDIMMLGVMFVNSFILIVAITFTLLVITPVGTIYVAAFFLVFYILLGKYTHLRLKRNGASIARCRNEVIKLLQEALHGIREIFLNDSREHAVNKYSQIDLELRRAQADNVFLSESPRYILETLGIVVVISLSYVLYALLDGASQSVLPTLGVLSLGALRLLPSVQYCFRSWAIISGNTASLEDLLEHLPAVEQSSDRIPSTPNKSEAGGDQHKIRLVGCSFSYPASTKAVLSDVYLEIPFGKHIGIVGGTGAGKSTLVDLITGLLRPSAGLVTIGEIDIHSTGNAFPADIFAYVHQTVFLYDGSILSNIVMDQSPTTVDMNRVIQCIKDVRLYEFVSGLPLGLNTEVGECGVQLSGGQRQRIALARALYKNRPILVLDEATSALDVETERLVMQNICRQGKRRSIIQISHRRETLNSCDSIFEVKNGQLIEIGY